MNLLQEHSNHLKSNLTQCKAIATELEMELNSLRDERDHLQEENNRLIQKSYEDDYRVENMKKRINYFVEQVEKFEAENKLLKSLVRLWA